MVEGEAGMGGMERRGKRGGMMELNGACDEVVRREEKCTLQAVQIIGTKWGESKNVFKECNVLIWLDSNGLDAVIW